MITLFIVTLGTMIAVVLYEAHFGTFSAKKFLTDYFILWDISMLIMISVSMLLFTTYTDKVYYTKTTEKNTYLQVTSRQYTTKFLGDDSLTYSPSKRVYIKEVPKEVYRFENGKWSF